MYRFDHSPPKLAKDLANTIARVSRMHSGHPCPLPVGHGCSILCRAAVNPCREFIRPGLSAQARCLMNPDMSDMIMPAANFNWRGLPVNVIAASAPRI
jgi:hypothetical protein